jgi:hypothetical protein
LASNLGLAEILNLFSPRLKRKVLSDSALQRSDGKKSV